MSSTKKYGRNRNCCRRHSHKCCRGCNSNSKPKPEPKPHMAGRIPVMPMDKLPEPETLENGTMFLVGEPMKSTDPMPNAHQYHFAVSNGDYYFAFSPSMLLA